MAAVLSSCIGTSPVASVSKGGGLKTYSDVEERGHTLPNGTGVSVRSLARVAVAEVASPGGGGIASRCGAERVVVYEMLSARIHEDMSLRHRRGQVLTVHVDEGAVTSGIHSGVEISVVFSKTLVPAVVASTRRKEKSVARRRYDTYSSTNQQLVESVSNNVWSMPASALVILGFDQQWMTTKRTTILVASRGGRNLNSQMSSGYLLQSRHHRQEV